MDQTLHCMICRTAFIHTEREQQFLEGLFREGKIDEVAAPKRCRTCRERKPRAPLVQIPMSSVVREPNIKTPAPLEYRNGKLLPPLPLGIPLKEEIQDPEERRDPAVLLKEVISNNDARAIADASRLPAHEEMHFVLVGGDFERLVCRQEVQLRGPKGQVITLKLAAIGLQTMKEMMEKAVLAWWRS